jgi:hypothetical protein
MADIIVKVQRPIGGTDMSLLLVYDETRTHEFFVPMNCVPGRELLKIMGKATKMYCRFRTGGQVENYNQWRYQGRVRDQRW